MQENRLLLAELEQVHASASRDADDHLKKYGDSVELRTMGTALSLIAEKIADLRAEVQNGLQEINKDVDELGTNVQVGLEEIKNDVEELNVKVQDELQQIEREVKELGDTTAKDSD